MADITVKNVQDFVMSVQTDKGVKEEYKFSNALDWPLKSSLIQNARAQVVQTLNLTEVFRNLNNGVMLLDITYHAVYGMSGLSNEVAALQSSLLNLMSDSLTTTQGFKIATKSAVEEFITAYGYLTKATYVNVTNKKNNGIGQACKVFERIMQRARDMSEEALKLADNFAGLRNETTRINQTIMKRRDLSYEQQESLAKKLHEMQAQVDGLKQIKSTLDEEIDAYTQEYNSLSRRAKQQDDRAFSLALTSAIIGGVSGIIGAIIPIGSNTKDNYSGGGTQGGTSGGAASSVKDGDSSLASKQAISQERVKTLQAELNGIEKEIAFTDAKLGQEGADKDALVQEKDTLVRKKAEKQKELDAEKEQSKVYTQAAEGISGGLNISSQKLDALAENQGNSADRLYDRIDKIATQKASLAKERRETIMQLATLTKSIEQGTVEEADLQVAINALITAVSCMRLVEVYLSDIAMFWSNVEKFCQHLIKSITSINEYAESFSEENDYTRFFSDAEFMHNYFLNTVCWVALYYISDEYVKAFDASRNEHKNAIAKSNGGTRKAHWELARQRAGEMSHIFGEQLLEINN